MQGSVQVVCSWFSDRWLGWKNQEIGLDILAWKTEDIEDNIMGVKLDENYVYWCIYVSVL